MTTKVEVFFISVCLERFFYGKILVLCASICTLAKEVQLFPGLGLYSGIFACIYNAYRESPAIILFYAVFLLYVLSTASFVGDLVTLIFEVSNILSVRILLCSGVSGHYRFNFKLTHSRCYLAFRLSEPQQAVVVTSSPNVFLYA
jgi:hypothetical protein